MTNTKSAKISKCLWMRDYYGAEIFFLGPPWMMFLFKIQINYNTYLIYIISITCYPNIFWKLNKGGLVVNFAIKPRRVHVLHREMVPKGNV